MGPCWDNRSPLRSYTLGMATTRTERLGPASRPVAVPDELDPVDGLKATGIVELPFHIRWSEPSVVYNLDLRADRVRVYEQVLREGTPEDVQHYVEGTTLVELFDDLVLPPSVRKAWKEWIDRHPGIDPDC